MPSIDYKDIENKYNNIENIWTEDDPWHFYTFKKIQEFIKIEFDKLNLGHNFSLLNAGSAGNTYEINCKRHIHVDLVEKNIIDKPHYIIGSIENLPLENNEIDFILCVGSVINYTDALSSIREFSRILNNKGHLVLEFENSYSLEYFSTHNFKKTANIVSTFYKGKEEKVWIYSHKFIKKSLEMNGFKIIKSKNFHILSPLIYRLCKNAKIASKFTTFDNVLSRIPFLKYYSSNVILLCQKVLVTT